MRKILEYGFIAVVSCFLLSCGETHIHEVVNRTKTIEIQTEVLVKKLNGNNDYKIIVIDGCEYIERLYRDVRYTQGGVSLCHKANCKNH